MYARKGERDFGFRLDVFLPWAGWVGALTDIDYMGAVRRHNPAISFYDVRVR